MSDENLSIAIQQVDDLQPAEAYDFADSRFLFVQPEMGMFYTRVMPNSTMPAHVHEDCHQFSFIVSGRGKVEIGDSHFEMSRGQCIRIPAGQTHSWHNPHPETLEYLEVKIPTGAGKDMVRFVKDRFPEIDDHLLAIGR